MEREKLHDKNVLTRIHIKWSQMKIIGAVHGTCVRRLATSNKETHMFLSEKNSIFCCQPITSVHEGGHSGLSKHIMPESRNELYLKFGLWNFYRDGSNKNSLETEPSQLSEVFTQTLARSSHFVQRSKASVSWRYCSIRNTFRELAILSEKRNTFHSARTFSIRSLK